MPNNYTTGNTPSIEQHPSVLPLLWMGSPTKRVWLLLVIPFPSPLHLPTFWTRHSPPYDVKLIPQQFR